MSKNIRINLIYLITWVLGFIILGISLAMYNVYGALAYVAITTICGVVALGQKNRLNVWWVWVLMIGSPGVWFPVAVLCLKTKEKRVIKRRASVAHN